MEFVHNCVFLMILCGCDLYKIPPRSAEWYAKFQEFLETPEPEEDIEVPPTPIDQVAFYLFTKENRHLTNITEENLNIVNKDLDKLFILIHGWLESREQPWYEDLTNALLDRYPNANVIQVDYSEPAFDFYPKSVASAKYVGEIVGKFLVAIHVKQDISTKKMIILPHSLGSHVAGFAGKTVQRVLPSLARIVALDPAGPRWDNKTCEHRLCKTDADVVVGLHTDAGDLGFAEPIGIIDFYANGGFKQNGCDEHPESEVVVESCGHCRSHAYFIEAMKHPTHFISKKCTDWKTYEENQNKCDKTTISLGDLETNTEGRFYFATHDRTPFAMEDSDGRRTPSIANIWISSEALIMITGFFVLLPTVFGKN